MSRNYHLISGLPRSGSTLLAAILRQNPRFHAGMSGPLGPIFNAMLHAIGPANETAIFLDENQRRRLLGSLFDTLHADIPQDHVVFDTNRIWTSLMPQIALLAPKMRVICCVRSVAWIMDSIERQLQKHPLQPSKLFASAEERSTVHSRTEALARRERLVGFAWSSLQEAYYGEFSNRLLILEYDILSQRPRDCMKLVYQFLGEPWYEHDFEHVEYQEEQFDMILGTPGLHTVRPTVAPIKRQTVLPPDLFRKFAALSFWRDATGSAAARITVDPNDGASDDKTGSEG